MADARVRISRFVSGFFSLKGKRVHSLYSFVNRMNNRLNWQEMDFDSYCLSTDGITDSILFHFLLSFIYSYSSLMNLTFFLVPLNVCTKLLLIICQSCASPTCGAITKCCFDGAITIERITPVPVTVIVRS